MDVVTEDGEAPFGLPSTGHMQSQRLVVQSGQTVNGATLSPTAVAAAVVRASAATAMVAPQAEVEAQTSDGDDVELEMLLDSLKEDGTDGGGEPGAEGGMGADGEFDDSFLQDFDVNAAVEQDRRKKEGEMVD